jgi:cell division GTPase FtsZ
MRCCWYSPETGEITKSAIVSNIALVAKEQGVITVGVVFLTLFTEVKESVLDIDKF